MKEQELRERTQSLLSGTMKGAIYYNGKWLIGQDCHLEIPEQVRLAKQILALISRKAKLNDGFEFGYDET